MYFRPNVHSGKCKFWKKSFRGNVLSAKCTFWQVKVLENNSNCNYILFTKLPWPGDSEGTFRSSSQAATCSSVYHTRWRLHTVPLIAEPQAGKL